jgi:hypothetical protein
MDQWDRRDRILALALTEMEDTTTRFGNPADVALDEMHEGEFEVRTVIDLEQAALDEWQRTNTKPGDGVRPYVAWIGSGANLQVDDLSKLLPGELDSPPVRDLDGIDRTALGDSRHVE